MSVAEAAAKELPPLNLTDALDLTMLIARKDPHRHPQVAARVLQWRGSANWLAAPASSVGAHIDDRIEDATHVVADAELS